MEQIPHCPACVCVCFLCRWGVLFSHPRDFTPVCTTELARAAKLSNEFKKRDVKMIALSIDSVEDHRNWCKVRVASSHPPYTTQITCQFTAGGVTLHEGDYCSLLHNADVFHCSVGLLSRIRGTCHFHSLISCGQELLCTCHVDRIQSSHSGWNQPKSPGDSLHHSPHMKNNLIRDEVQISQVLSV